jgi:hypothetical protein
VPETEVAEKPKGKPNRPATFDRLRKKQPITKKLKIWLEDFPEPDPSEFWPPDSTPLESQKAAYEQARADWQARMDEASVVLTLRAIGRKAYGELVDQHPPTEEQRREAKDRGMQPLDYNPESFAPEIIAASLVDPELSKEEVKILFDEWNQGEVTRLYLAALEVNTGSKIADFSKGFGAIPF